MHRNRFLGIVGLVGLLGVLTGCSGDPKPAPLPAPAPAPGPNPPPDPNKPDPKAPPNDLYELDPTKHSIPPSPVTGFLAGKAFTPDRIELEGDRLTFRQGKGFFADASIEISLNNKKNLSDGVTLIVKPTQKWTDGIPPLTVSSRKNKDDLPDPKFVNDGYALTLEFGKFEKGQARGKINLSLPGADRSYLAGTFTVQRKRALSDPVSPEDVPYIQGAVSPPLKKGQSIWVGYVGILGDGKTVSDGAGCQVFDEGDGGARSESFAPRTAGVRFEKFTPYFDFTKLPAGRYLVFARVKDGSAAWKWVTVAADSKETAELKFDEKNAGTVEVKLPAGEPNARLVPADLGTPPPDELFVGQLSFSLGLSADAKDGKATITGVPAGKYQVRAGALRAEIEVTAGKTTNIELKKN